MRVIYSALLAAVAIGVSPMASTAELEITSVRGATGPKVGAKLDDAAVLDVPDSGELRLLKHPGATTFVVTGPFQGTLQQYVERCRGVRAWFWSNCGPTGKGDPLPSGGTRGIAK
jgi:hypothetical protein